MRNLKHKEPAKPPANVFDNVFNAYAEASAPPAEAAKVPVSTPSNVYDKVPGTSAPPTSPAPQAKATSTAPAKVPAPYKPPYDPYAIPVECALCKDKGETVSFRADTKGLTQFDLHLFEKHGLKPPK